ncbi:MAG TPA: Zn-ribbon domain-containing OB-fold protein [Mycobacteriales bacterium]|jgi:uncharacterized OB-fold protein|nr:Zn-ribbon domain-containing OB-fold protein [Mycobacteriales bacterium]
MTSGRPRSDLPTIEPETEPFWQAAAEGRFLIRRCADCGRAHHYPRPFCPFCWSGEVPWEEASGRATLYTYSTVYLNDLPPFDEQVPYVAAVVDLEEGPRVMTRIIEATAEELSIGMPLEVTFSPLNDDIVAPYFRPAR